MGKGTKSGKKARVGTDKNVAAEECDFSICNKKNLIILFAIFSLGLFLRIFEIWRKPLWLDEASSYFLTNQTNVMDVWTAAFNDHHAPLHFIVLWTVKWIGSNEFWLRIPSAIAGTLTILVVFLLARELANEETGLIAAALIAVSPYHILYSQEARMYGMAVLFISLAFYMFFRAARTRSFTDWAVFGVSCALAFYTHFYTSFAILALLISYVIIRWKEFRFPQQNGDNPKASFTLPSDFRYFLLGVVISGILVTPLLGSFFNQSGYFVSHTFNWGISMWNIPWQTFLMFSDYSELVAVIFICLMIIAFGMIWYKNRERTMALAVIMFVPMLISMYLSQVIPFNVRYHLYLIVVFLSLVAIPLAWVAQKMHQAHGVLVLISVIILVSTIPLASYYTEPLQEDWKTVSGNLNQITQSGDIIAPLPWYMVQPLSYYYNNATDGTYYQNFALNESGFHSLDNTTGSVFYIVTWDITAADPTGYSLNYLKEHTEQTKGSVPGIYVLKKVR
jgi:mannosyltransferase